MNIDSIIDRECYHVSILEDLDQIAEWLQEKPYFAVVDEELQIVGIITQRDILREKGQLLIDCFLEKPIVTPLTALREVFDLMVSSESHYLPVYEKTVFIGVIAMQAITGELIKRIDHLEHLLKFKMQ